MSARILVVDDVPANVKLLEARLSAEYFDVITAMRGDDALAIDIARHRAAITHRHVLEFALTALVADALSADRPRPTPARLLLGVAELGQDLHVARVGSGAVEDGGGEPRAELAFERVIGARLPQFAARGWTRRDIEDLLFYGVLGTVIGGRLGYVLFYNPSYFVAHPLESLQLWKGGMSFHGGVAGTSLGIIYFARKEKLSWLRIHDYVACCVPFGLFFGRMIKADIINKVAEDAEIPSGLFDSFAENALGYMLGNGRGVKQDRARSFALYKRGCDGASFRRIGGLRAAPHPRADHGRQYKGWPSLGRYPV